MKAFVKLLAISTTIALSQPDLSAQLKINPINGFTHDLKKVMDDYPRFNHIRGDEIVQNPQSIDYQSTLKLSGAEECTITRYTSKKEDVMSWQATMLTTEKFDDARKKFRSLFTQLNDMFWNGLQLKGSWEAPTEEKKFNSILFSFGNSNEILQKLKIELVMEADMLEWKVRVLVYNREREDNEQGDIVE